MDAASNGSAESGGRQDQVYRHPNARKTPGTKVAGEREHEHGRLESEEGERRSASPTPAQLPPPQRRAPSRAGQSTPAYPDTVWDPIHALSRRSRSNTDGFFSPLIHQATDTAGGDTITMRSSGPLDAASAAGGDPFSASTGSGSDPVGNSAVFQHRGLSERFIGGLHGGVDLRIGNNGQQQQQQQRNTVPLPPSFPPSARDAAAGNNTMTRPAKDGASGLSIETSEDLRRLFSPAGRGFSEALADPMSWRHYDRHALQTHPPGVRDAQYAAEVARLMSMRGTTHNLEQKLNQQQQQQQQFQASIGYLGMVPSVHHHALDPLSSSESSSLIDSYEAVRGGGGRSRRDTGFSDSLGSFGPSSPTFLPPQNPIYRPTFADKQVQTEECATAENAGCIRDILELRQARSDMQLLFAENRGLRRQLYDMLAQVRSMRPQHGSGLSWGMATGAGSQTGRGGGVDLGRMDPSSSSYQGQLPTLADATAATAASFRNVPGGLPGVVGPAMQQSPNFGLPADLFRPAPASAAATITSLDRRSMLKAGGGLRTEAPASLEPQQQQQQQQQRIAEFSNRGQPFVGGGVGVGAEGQEHGRAAGSPLRGGSSYTGTPRDDEGRSDASVGEASTAQLSSKPSWPSLAEAQRHVSKAKIGTTPPEPRTPQRGQEGPGGGHGGPSNDGGALSPASQNDLVRQILDGRGQEASIVLQQQLKLGSADAKRSVLGLVESCILALSRDRHGNFLVQRALGVVSELAWKLKGHFVELAMSQFGCHVVQRVLDGEERVKAAVVEELLTSRLEKSLTSRHSVHVWQKVLEINWARQDFRSTIFAVMNRQMKGKWAQTARQETGSIICQNIFESADADEKSDCLQEVLAEAEDCASNQWGVWVVQHIIEHGSDQERRAALDGLLRSAVKLTLSQYGQKAIMSGLKSDDRAFIDRYADTLCKAQPASVAGTGSRRSALVDIALAPQGLQIVTQLLTSVTPEVREKVIATVRKNSVFLKGSKTGLKVHQLCERARAFSGY